MEGNEPQANVRDAIAAHREGTYESSAEDRRLYRDGKVSVAVSAAAAHNS